MGGGRGDPLEVKTDWQEAVFGWNEVRGAAGTRYECAWTRARDGSLVKV